jgi:GrpB-like predicted nucleotidyltransferase (UPF0157 family)
MADEVEIVAYDPRWPQMFRDEAARVREVLPDNLLLGIEHFGSTAVPGLAAKPIIDILVFVRSLEAARCEAVPSLETLGYSFWRDNPVLSTLFFVKGLPPNGPRTHHIHMVEEDAADPRRAGGCFRDRLLFRDYLRANPEAALRYTALKSALASRFPNDREAYTDGKTEFILAILNESGHGMRTPAV